MSDVCPNCGRPREIHELFARPRCPVVRLSFPPTGEFVTYSKTTEYDDLRLHRASCHLTDTADVTCSRCRDGWVCEQHPDQPAFHDDCAGPGMPCGNGCDVVIAAAAVEILASVR